MTSDRDGYNHIYLFNAKGKELDQLTKGEFDVIEFVRISMRNAKRSSTHPLKKELLKRMYTAIDISGTGKRRLSPQDGSNDVVFSEGFKYYTYYHSTANSPTDIKLYNERGKVVRTLVDNAELIKTLSEYDISPKEFFTFKTERGDELNGWHDQTSEFRHKKKYPVLLAIYGGPGHNTVTNSFGGATYYWHQMLAQKGDIS